MGIDFKKPDTNKAVKVKQPKYTGVIHKHNTMEI